jgi:hypothetical protein
VRLGPEIGGDPLNGFLAIRIERLDEAITVGSKPGFCLLIENAGGNAGLNTRRRTFTIRSAEEDSEGFEEVTVGLEKFGRENNGNGNQAIIEGLNGQLVTEEG